MKGTLRDWTLGALLAGVQALSGCTVRADVARNGGEEVPPASDALRKYVKLVAASSEACLLRSDGSIGCFPWPEGPDAMSAPVEGIFTDLSVAGGMGVARRSDGTLAYWGGGAVQLLGSLSGVVTAGIITCGLETDGQVLCDSVLPAKTPARPFSGFFKQLALAGPDLVCGLSTAGELTCVGGDAYTVQPPSADVIGPLRFITLEEYSSTGGCGLAEDHSLRCWGAICPMTGKFKGVALTHMDACALDLEGYPSCWRDATDCSSPPTWGPRPEPPPGRFSQIASGTGFTCVLALDGNDVQCWGY